MSLINVLEEIGSNASFQNSHSNFESIVIDSDISAELKELILNKEIDNLSIKAGAEKAKCAVLFPPNP